MYQGQSPHFVDWAITGKCNLNCRHCRGVPETELSTERAKKLIAEIAELKPGWIFIEGGEPLLRQDLFQLLGLIQQKRIAVRMSTNGLLLTPQIIATLKQLEVRVMISIDGATPETYQSIRGEASFEKVVAQASNCAQAGILEAINFVILKRNYTEIPAIFKLAVSVGVPKVTLIGLKPCHDYSGELLSPQEYHEAVKLACQAAQETGVEFFFDEPFFWAIVKESGLTANKPAVDAGIVIPSTSACAFGEYLFIESTGEVKPCSFAPLVVGNVNERPLGEIWREMQDSSLIDRIKDPNTRVGYCRDCQYLADCKGCRSRTVVLTGDWFASDPVCPLCPG
ncbi:radical SAM/SPASM domain-containing protein [Chloroflexota bacterium]